MLQREAPCQRRRCHRFSPLWADPGWCSPCFPLITRLVLGHTFYTAGLGKLAQPENTAALFGALGIPLSALSAALAARVETLGGLALAMGLLCRPAAATLAMVMAVAMLTADRPRVLEALGPSATFGLADIPSVVLLLLLSWLVTQGAGPLSVDALVVWSIRRWRARRSGSAGVPPGSRAQAPPPGSFLPKEAALLPHSIPPSAGVSPPVLNPVPPHNVKGPRASHAPRRRRPRQR